MKKKAKNEANCFKSRFTWWAWNFRQAVGAGLVLYLYNTASVCTVDTGREVKIENICLKWKRKRERKIKRETNKPPEVTDWADGLKWKQNSRHAEMRRRNCILFTQAMI